MWNIVLYSFVAGVVATGLGGFIGAFLFSQNGSKTGCILAFSGGIMLAIVCFELLPDSVQYSNIYLTLASCMLGYLFIVFLNNFVSSTFEKRMTGKYANMAFVKMGLLMCLAIALHNLPEGLVVGASGVIEGGIVLTVLISLHNVLEGAAMSVSMSGGGMNKVKSGVFSALSGLPTVVGGVIGFLLASVSDSLIATCLGLAGGAMLRVVFADVLPNSYKLSPKLTSLMLILGLLTGMFITNF